MKKRKIPEPIIVKSYEDIPDFASEDEEREWWATHDLADELWEDVTAEQKALIQRLRMKYRYVRTDRKSRAA